MVSFDPRELFDDHLSGSLGASDAARLEKALGADAGLRRELDDYVAGIEAIRALPARRAPVDLALRVQHRIRRRTRGRHFSWGAPRTSVLEVAACAVLIFLLAAVAVISGPVHPPSEAGVERVRLAPADARSLEMRGTIESIGTALTGNGLVVAVLVPAAQEDAFRDELGRNPRLSVEHGRTMRGADVLLRVIAEPGPMAPAL